MKIFKFGLSFVLPVVLFLGCQQILGIEDANYDDGGNSASATASGGSDGDASAGDGSTDGGEDSFTLDLDLIFTPNPAENMHQFLLKSTTPLNPDSIEPLTLLQNGQVIQKSFLVQSFDTEGEQFVISLDDLGPARYEMTVRAASADDQNNYENSKAIIWDYAWENVARIYLAKPIDGSGPSNLSDRREAFNRYCENDPADTNVQILENTIAIMATNQIEQFAIDVGSPPSHYFVYGQKPGFNEKPIFFGETFFAETSQGFKNNNPESSGLTNLVPDTYAGVESFWTGWNSVGLVGQTCTNTSTWGSYSNSISGESVPLTRNGPGWLKQPEDLPSGVDNCHEQKFILCMTWSEGDIDVPQEASN